MAETVHKARIRPVKRSLILGVSPTCMGMLGSGAKIGSTNTPKGQRRTQRVHQLGKHACCAEGGGSIVNPTAAPHRDSRRTLTRRPSSQGDSGSRTLPRNLRPSTCCGLGDRNRVRSTHSLGRILGDQRLARREAAVVRHPNNLVGTGILPTWGPSGPTPPISIAQ